MDLLLAMMIAALLVGGQGVAILGTIKMPLATRLQIDEARVGGLVSLFGFTMIPVIFLAGFLTDQVGQRMVMMGGCILVAVSLFALGRCKNYAAALAAVVLFSAGWSFIINVSNVLTPRAFGGSEAYATNFANFFFGLGAFLTPLVVTTLLRFTSFGLVLSLLGGFALVPALLALGVTFSAAAGGTATADPGFGPLLVDPVLWLCGLALFCYGPMEASLAAWNTTYLAEQGVKEATAAKVLSGFWLAYMAARLITAFVLPPNMERTLILALALTSAVILALMVASRQRGVASLLVLAAGLVLGPIFPTIMAVLLHHFPSEVHGRAVGLFFAIGGVGWTIVPILIGNYARRATLQRALIIVVAVAVGLAGVALALLYQG